MKKRQAVRAFGRTSPLLFACAAFGLAPALLSWNGSSAAGAASLPLLKATPPPALQLMVRTIGLNGDALAAVGASSAQVSAAVAALRGSPLLDQLAQLQLQITAAETARKTAVTALPPDEAQIAAAAAAVEQLQTQRATIVAAARELVKGQLNETQAAALANWWAAPPFLPPPMRVRAWSASDLKDVREALQAEKRATDRSEQVPATAASVLATVRAEPAVVTATSNLTHQAETSTQLAAAIANTN